MPEVLFATDRTPVAGLDELPSGAIRVRARLARDGLQEYAPWPGAPIADRMIRVYRPPAEVFADASLSTLRSIPVTVGHPPPREVTAKTWKRYAVGHVEGHEVSTVDAGEQFIETAIVVSDADAIEQVRSKQLQEISQGYYVQLDWSPGTTPDGKPYDAIQRQIVHNHTALLRAGDARAGAGARVLLDSSAEPTSMTEEEIKKLVADGIAAHEKAKAEADAKAKADEEEEEEAKKKADEEEEEEAKKKADEDPEEAKKKAEADRKAGEEAARKALQADATDAAVALIDTRDAAKSMLPADYDFVGKDARTIKLDALKACAPKLKLAADASDATIDGAFQVLRSQGTRYVKPRTEADNKPADHFAEYHKRMNDAFVTGGR